MQIKDIMSSEFTGVTPDTKIIDAINFMNDDYHSCTLVTDGEKLFGIFTERDAVNLQAKFFANQSKVDFFNSSIDSVMTDTPIFVNENSDIFEVIVIAKNNGIRHFPVLDAEDKLVGLVTQTDIMTAYTRLIKKLSLLEANNHELQALALEDPLMQIGNRRAMEIDLKYSQSLAFRKKISYAIAIFDVDFFKKYNDTYGHQKGDEALKQIADCIKHVIRDSDRIYRYGGEEVLVLMPDTTTKQAMEVSIRVRQSIAQLDIEHESSDKGVLTVSGGVASSIEDTWPQLVKKADKMLYIAKSSGRNQVCVA